MIAAENTSVSSSLHSTGDSHHLENALTEQQMVLSRVVAELRQLHDAFSERTRAEIAALLEENDSLRRRLDEQPLQATSRSGQPDLEGLKSENERLKASLAEQQILLEQSKAREHEPESIDVESYEAALLRERRQLDADRQKFERELEHMRTRREEIDEATREMEMEFSRERAELARERMRLDRLREEVRAELERFQRDAPVRESLKSVQRLREKITQGKSSPK